MNLEEVLAAAIDDEYQARATYRAVLEAFGPVRPFVNIVESEGRHVQALLGLYDRFGLQPPPDEWPSKVGPPDSVADACRQAVAAEQENAKLYERLLAASKDPSVRRVLKNLQRASQENHLPAFQRCLEREESGGGAGKGCGGGGGGRRRRRRHGHPHST